MNQQTVTLQPTAQADQNAQQSAQVPAPDEIYDTAKGIFIDARDEVEVRIHRWLDQLGVEMSDPLDKKDAYYNMKRQQVFRQLSVRTDSTGSGSGSGGDCSEHDPGAKNSPVDDAPPKLRTLSFMHSSIMLKRKNSMAITSARKSNNERDQFQFLSSQSNEQEDLFGDMDVKRPHSERLIPCAEDVAETQPAFTLAHAQAKASRKQQ